MNTMKSITHTKAFEMNLPVEALFPLFSPEGEKHWVPGWHYQNIMGTTKLSEDYVFTTQSHDHADTDAIWIVKAYDPGSHFVQFYKVEPGYKVGVITVKCSALEDSKTEINVTYTYIALSATGETFVSGFTERDYEAFINEWEKIAIELFRSDGLTMHL